LPRARTKPRPQPSRSELVCQFIETYLRIPEGAHVGRPFNLRPFQVEIIRAIYDTPTRWAIVSMPRKNGKTQLAAALLLAHLVGPEAEPNSQVYSAALSRDQASVVFQYMAKMIRLSPDLQTAVAIRDSNRELVCTLNGARYRALSADSTRAYGLSPAVFLFDEAGQIRGPRSDMFDALATAQGAHDHPLGIVISTEASDDGDFFSLLVDDARKSQDARTRLVHFGASAEDDPWLEATWRKANPALGDFANLETFRDEAEKARRIPSQTASFLNLRLNLRIAARSTYLSPIAWNACAAEAEDSAFERGKVFAGLDLSQRQDLTALVLLATDDKGGAHCRVHCWTPADTLVVRTLRDRAPYDVWVSQGILETAPGASIALDWLAARLIDILAPLAVEKVLYDRWRMAELVAALDRRGAALPLFECGQGYQSMAPALDALDELVLNRRLRHGANPLLTWCVSNATVLRDPAGNRKLDKGRTEFGRIDAAVALAMAAKGFNEGEQHQADAGSVRFL
jgi:phage terminase large subunit-like protein